MTDKTAVQVVTYVLLIFLNISVSISLFFYKLFIFFWLDELAYCFIDNVIVFVLVKRKGHAKWLLGTGLVPANLAQLWHMVGASGQNCCYASIKYHFTHGLVQAFICGSAQNENTPFDWNNVNQIRMSINNHLTSLKIIDVVVESVGIVHTLNTLIS